MIGSSGLSVASTLDRAHALLHRVPMGASERAILGYFPTFGAWFDSLHLGVDLFYGGPTDFSHGDGATIHLRTNDLLDPSMAYLYDPHTGVGYADVAAWMLHEARHTDPGGGARHTVGPYGPAITMDGTFAEHGSWWIEHVFYQALARIAGLTPWERMVALRDARSVLGNIGGGRGRPSAIAKIPHLSAQYCASGGGFPYCGRG